MPVNCPLGIYHEAPDACSTCRYQWQDTCRVFEIPQPLVNILTLEERVYIIEQQRNILIEFTQPVLRKMIDSLNSEVAHIHTDLHKLQAEQEKKPKKKDEPKGHIPL